MRTRVLRSAVGAGLVSMTLAPVAVAGVAGAPSQVAAGLETPWELAATPDGRTLVTELPGRIRVIGANGRLAATPVLRAEQADPQTRKFLGLALHPAWTTNRTAYLYVNYRPAGGLRSKILRLREQGGTFAVQATVFDGIASDATTTAVAWRSAPTAGST